MIMVFFNSETLEKRLRCSFEKFISDRVFPGAVVGIYKFSNGKVIKKTFPFGKIDDSDLTVKNNTIYDCASLTKPLVTVLSLLSLKEEKKIYWDERLGDLISFRIPKVKQDISLSQLMSHCSGLPAYRPYYKYLVNFEPAQRKKEIIRMILAEDLIYSPGEEHIYSDLGYILLGHIIEETSGIQLDLYWKRKIVESFNLSEKLIFQDDKELYNKNFASTGFCTNTGKKIYGIVHDDNCRMLGGVSGHAGLFGTADGILSICENILLAYHNMIKLKHINTNDIKTVLEKKDCSSWTLGFDTPSQNNSSSGKFFSKNSIGHLGFTGTSFWIDINKKIIIVFLSNRVFFGDENEKMKKVRPIVHDIIMEEIIDW
jgi:serine-type D-Ala-D-Ala carboxypeptidase